MQKLAVHVEGGGKGAGDRWVTSTASALEAVAAKLGEARTREEMAEDLRERKAKNYNTAICFGFERSDYITDAMSRQRDCLQPVARAERGALTQHNNEIKANLTRTNFRLGECLHML
jgi:hypothetical protein